jgi:uncharacterized protein (DUF1015 family)
MKISGIVERVYKKQTSREDIFSIGLLIQDKWYNMATKYPDNVKVGDSVVFTVDDKNNIAYKSLQKSTVEDVSSSGLEEIHRKLDVIIEKIIEIEKARDAIPDLINQLVSSLRDDLPDSSFL